MRHRVVELIGPHNTARFIRARADELVLWDNLSECTAIAIVCDRVLSGDRLTLSTPGQVWRLRPGVDPGEAPAEQLRIVDRLLQPPRILVEDKIGIRSVLPIDVLERYDLFRWPVGSSPS